MDRLIDLLENGWFALALLTAGFVLGLWLLVSWLRGQVPSWPIVLLGAAFGLTGLGGLLSALADTFHWADHPLAWAWWAAGIALAVLFGMLIVLVSSGAWSARLAWCAGALVLVGFGGLGGHALSRELALAGKVLIRMEVVQPWWLLLLGLLPPVVWLSIRSLAGLGPVRRWIAIGLRCLLVLLLTLALADVRLRRPIDRVTVLFLVDRSLSVPEDFEANPQPPPPRIDRRWERIKRFINRSVEDRGRGHVRDRVGVIVFGRRPRLELPPAVVRRLNFSEVAITVDGNYTDIAAAIKLALASFPEGTARRIVLLSDGNENLGNAVEQARIARRNGVQIDVVPLAAGYRSENEVMVQSVEAPPRIEQHAQVPIRVLIRSFSPHVVIGTLTLRQITQGQTVNIPPSPFRVKVRQGLNPILFRRSLARQEEQSFTYEARFDPEWVEDEQGERLAVATAALQKYDRVQNNRATTHVIARGQRRILLIEPREGDHQFLVDHLRQIGHDKFKVHTITAEALPQDRAELAVFLSDYDCVILANVAASDVGQGAIDDPARQPLAAITEQQQEVIRSNAYDQGCGLIMIGGPNGFGAGGWRGTPVEKALPVNCDIKSLEVTGKGGLVLIMHASEMAEGNRWQKEVAKLAIKKLSPLDMLGMLYYDWMGGGHRWHIPFQTVGNNRARMLRLVDQMSPGDMPDVDPALEKAYSALTNPKNELTVKHIIFISDGDHWQANNSLLAKLRGSKITCSTVCITTHGVTEEQKMADVARRTNGRFYNVRSPRALPAIYIKETRIVSQSYIYAQPFQPRLIPYSSGPTVNLPSRLPGLYGYVRTTPKERGFVQVPIIAPPSADQQFPILAYWHYGLGKSVAFTSDARTLANKLEWDRDWAASDMYSRFWDQVVDWSLRAVETGELTMTSEYNDGKVKVIVDARDAKDPTGRPLTGLTLAARVTPPSGKAEDAPPLKLKEINAGVYEGEFKAEEAGSYFIHAQSVPKEKGGKVYGVRSGVTIPYSPEFADMESNAPLLEKLRALTGGRSYADSDQALDAAAASGEVFRWLGLPPSRSLQPVWSWLLVLAGIILFFDVAVRRIALDAGAVTGAAERWWARMRGYVLAAEETPQFLERLKTRKAQIAESIDKARAAQRFEAGQTPAGAPAGAEVEVQQPERRPAARTAPPQPVGPEAEQEAADYASRLLRAKKRVWKEREKDQDQ